MLACLTFAGFCYKTAPKLKQLKEILSKYTAKNSMCLFQNSALSRCYKLQGVDGSVVLQTARRGWLRRGLPADIIRDDFNFFVFTFTFNWEYFVERISGKVKLFECW